jgi:formylmethanofuran dehydrogenase subunit C
MSKSALTFTLKKSPTFKVNCSQLIPEKLAGKTTEQILEITLNNSIKVIDLFKISGENYQDIIFKNSHSQLDYIGHQMLSGSITIEGNCGNFMGANMRGGSIICTGNTGDRVGDLMRRGLILIDGNAGDYCASRMVAGTIGVHGNMGKYTGFGMKRGTILLKNSANFHATIQDCGMHNLPFLTLLFKSFNHLNSQFSKLDSTRVQRYCGDIAANGSGEILILKS